MVFKWLADDSDTTQECTKVELNIEVIELDDFASLELCSNLSTIVLNLPKPNSSLEHSKKVIDSLADLLNTKQNIKSLEIPDGARIGSQCTLSRAYLLEILASGQAGENLESLSIAPANSIGNAPAVLGRYLRRNRNLKHLHLRLTKRSPDLELISMLPATTMTHIRLIAFKTTWFPDVYRRLGQCSSISSLNIGHVGHSDAEHIDALASLVIQCPALQHFYFNYLRYEGCLDPWLRLGLALSSMKTLKLGIDEKPLLQVLPHLYSCQSLEITLFGDPDRSIASIIARLPTLKTIRVLAGAGNLQLREDALLDMVKFNKSITKATLTPVLKPKTSNPVLQAKVDSF